MTPFTQTNSAFVDKDGRITPPWRIILDKLWRIANGDKMGAQQLLSGPLTLGTSTLVYTASAMSARIDAITLANNDASVIKVDLHFVKPGDSPNLTNVVARAVSVNAAESKRATDVEGQVLPKGWSLFGVPTIAGSVVVTTSGTPMSIQ